MDNGKKGDDNNNSLIKFFDELMDKKFDEHKINNKNNIDYKDVLLNSLYS